MSTQKRQPPSFAKNFNKAAIKLAGHWFMPLWAVVQHRGRKSGKPYRTPIAIIGSTSKAVYIGLPWGRGTDWVRNIEAGGGTLAWKGKTFTVVESAFAGKDEVLAEISGLRRELTRRSTIEDYLRLTLQPAS